MKLRLSDSEIKMIKELATEIFRDCRIYIFGSRALLSKEGGDVNIFVVPKNNLFGKKLRFSSSSTV